MKRKYIDYIFIDLLSPIVSALIFVLLKAVSYPEHKHFIFYEEIPTALYGYFFGFIVVAQFRRIRRINNMRTTNDELEKLNNNIGQQILLNNLFNRNLNKHKNFSGLLANILKDVTEQKGGGLYLTTIDNPSYIRILKGFLSCSEHSIKATLTEIHKPSWFFNKDDDTFSSEQKLSYLKQVNNPHDGIHAIRIIIMNETILRDDLNSLTAEEAIKFFECQANVSLFFIDSEKFKTQFIDTRIIPDYCFEDYVLFDDFIIAKRPREDANRKLILMCAYHSVNEEYKKIFSSELMNGYSQLFKSKKEIIEMVNISLWSNADRKKLQKLGDYPKKYSEVVTVPIQ